MSSQIGTINIFNKKDKSYKMYLDAMHDQKNSNMVVKLRSEDGKEKDYNLPLFVNEAPYILSENLAHYPSIDNLKMALDMIRENLRRAPNCPALTSDCYFSDPCLIAGGKILTFDNASLPFVPEEKFTLIAGVCTENSPFAVFGRKTSQSSALVSVLF